MNNALMFSTGKDDRFWSKVRRSSGCWEWTAYRKATGYGLFKVGGKAGRAVRAHRHAWELARGPVPVGLHVLHDCDNPACVNPDHLRIGTHQENMRARDARGRGNIAAALATRKARHGY